MNKEQYLDQFARNREAILAAAEMGFDPPIKGCPGWDVGALTAHMGSVYTFWGKWVRERPRGGDDKVAWGELEAERDAGLPGLIQWRKAGFPPDQRPSGIIEFATSTGDRLEAMLRELDPDEPVWSFIPGRKNAAFTFRRIAHETTMHRWDAEQAHGIEKPIEATFALDGLDEMLDAMLPEIGQWDNSRENRTGQRFRLTVTDESEGSEPGSRSWLVIFDRDRMRTIPDDGAAVDAQVSGPASDLLLYIMGRLTGDEVHVGGDYALANRWCDLTGRF